MTNSSIVFLAVILFFLYDSNAQISQMPTLKTKICKNIKLNNNLPPHQMHPK